MGRITDALNRVQADAPPLAGPIAAPLGEPPNGSALDRYPSEDRPYLQGPGGPEPMPARAPITADPRPDAVPARFDKAYRTRLVSGEDVPPAAVEQYRRLAATMHHLQVEQGLKRLMVASAVPKEGKTLTAVNLAMTLSESYGRRVLLIDADLRRPSLHTVFGISSRHGLADALRFDHPNFQLARVSETLWVLPAGSPNADPMAALASRQLERLLDDLSSQFDWILIDSPPSGSMADGALLARLTRAVILVIAAGSTPHNLLEKVISDLGRDHIVGVVLNRVAEDAVHWSPYYGP